MEFVAVHIGKGFGNSTIKIFTETDINVSGRVSFQQQHSVSIAGRNGNTISCNCSGKSSMTTSAGLTFVDVWQVHISNISLVNCCGTLGDSLNAALVLRKSSNVIY